LDINRYNDGFIISFFDWDLPDITGEDPRIFHWTLNQVQVIELLRNIANVVEDVHGNGPVKCHPMYPLWIYLQNHK
jgi:hypothetical protein